VAQNPLAENQSGSHVIFLFGLLVMLRFVLGCTGASLLACSPRRGSDHEGRMRLAGA
jgi:hypothetical protein